MVAWPAGSAEDDVPTAADACDARSAGGDFEPNAAGTITKARRTRVRRSDSPPRRRQDLRRARDHRRRVASIAGREVDPRPRRPARSKLARFNGPFGLDGTDAALADASCFVVCRSTSWWVRPVWPLRQAPSCLQHLRCESTRGYHARTEAISCARAAARTRSVQARPPRVVRDRCSGRRVPSSAGAAAGQAGRA